MSKGIPHRKPRRPRSGHVYSSNKQRRSESLSKTHCCCTRSSMASGSQTTSRSTAISVAISLPTFLSLAERQGATVPMMVGHRVMGVTLLSAGDFSKSRAHLDAAFALYDPVQHRPLATRFGQDAGVAILGFRSWLLWFLGYPEAALSDADHLLEDARNIGQAATLMVALTCTGFTHRLARHYATASLLFDELLVLRRKKRRVLEGGRNRAAR